MKIIRYIKRLIGWGKVANLNKLIRNQERIIKVQDKLIKTQDEQLTLYKEVLSELRYGVKSFETNTLDPKVVFRSMDVGYEDVASIYKPGTSGS